MNDRVDRWRQRAKELRAMAEQMTHKDARKVVKEIADEWDRMADQVANAERKPPDEG